jgi:hypothetical protein
VAILKMGTVIVGIRGTVGGLTCAANKSGPYARVWSRGANARTVLQGAARRDLGQWAAYWQSLDAGDQADWDTWADDPAQARTNSLGESYQMSGFQAFVGMSRNLASVGRGVIETAPVVAKPVAPPGMGAVVSAGAVASKVTYGAGTFTPLYDLVVEMSLGATLGRQVAGSAFYVIAVAQVPAGTEYDVTAGIVARWGIVAVGQRAFLRVYRQNLEGYRSAPTAVTVDVVA